MASVALAGKGMTTTERVTSTAPVPVQQVAQPMPQAGGQERRWWLYLAIGAGALLFLVLAVALVAHRRGAAAMAAANTGGVAEVKRGLVEKTVESAGSVVSNLDVDIKCRASGEIVKLPFDKSQKVHKGDLLCQLDPTDEQLVVRSADSDVSLSTAKLAQAKQNYETARLNLGTTRDKAEATLASTKVKAANLAAKAERQQQLIDQQLGSKEEYETAQTDAAAAKADARAAEVAIEELKQQEIQLSYKQQDVRSAEIQLEKDRTSLDTAQRQLAYTTVTSPMDATVSAVSVPLGYQVQSGTGGFSGGTTIMSLSDLSRIFVLATVDQSDIGGVAVGQAARVVVDSFPGRTFTGKVVRKAPTGTSTSNVVTFEVKVEVLDEHKDLLAPQMTGVVTIIEDSRDGVLHVPAMAVTREAGKAYVVLKGGARKEVTVGLAGAEEVEITGGVSAGDTVVLGAEELPTKWKSNSQPGGGPPK